VSASFVGMPAMYWGHTKSRVWKERGACWYSHYGGWREGWSYSWEMALLAATVGARYEVEMLCPPERGQSTESGNPD
jgi:hypothetical protein